MSRNVETGDTDLKNVMVGTPLMKVEQMIDIRVRGPFKLTIELNGGILGQPTAITSKLEDLELDYKAGYSGTDIDGGLKKIIKAVELNRRNKKA